MMTLFQLFFQFFQVGLFSIGGGLATLPFLYHLSDTMGWFTYNDIANMIAIAESTPGAIGINMASYAGYITAGIPGALLATVGLVTPCIIIIICIARILQRFREKKYLNGAFFGLRPASLALISVAGISVVKIALINLELKTILFPNLLLAIFIYLFQKKTKCHPIMLIFIGAIIGILFKF